MNTQEPLAFVAFASCGHLVAAVVDEPEYVRETAKEVANWIRQGLRVEKLSCEAVRTGPWCSGTCTRRRACGEAKALGIMAKEALWIKLPGGGVAHARIGNYGECAAKALRLLLGMERGVV